MKSFFDKLNLRPGERRLVVGVGIVVFLILNFVFVFPNFGKDGILKQRITDAEKTLKRFREETNSFKRYQTELDKLQKEGVIVGQDDPALVFQNEVNRLANEAGVLPLRIEPTPRVTTGRTNAFFDESLLTMTFGGTGEKELITFLYNLGSRNSLIRVRSMNIGPEIPARMKLQGRLDLVESFQKKPPARTAVTAAPASVKPSPPPAAKAPPVKTPEKKPSAPTPPPKPTTGTKTTNAVTKPGAKK